MELSIAVIPVVATSVAGGEIHPQEGSGTLTVTKPSDAQVEAGDENVDITLVYEAATVLTNFQLEIDVRGIVLKDDPDTTDVMEMLEEGTDNKKYGQVSGSGTASNPSLGIGAFTAEC